ncbi:MAG: four helix bundle protein [Bacteroidales bacterium]|jgi:four helix bundle protein|nr:four helix bundle protein [Bacteroidales bacterium]MDD4213237.1 four helix bundle protein [Bacteroidales bacterium]
MRDHNKIRAFELSDEFVLLIYNITKQFPKEEVYGLTSQIRRAAVSVPSNIVEGCARKTEGEYKRFLDVAFGSFRELKYQFGLAYRLGYVKDTDIQQCNSKLTETEKVLSALIRSLR